MPINPANKLPQTIPQEQLIKLAGQEMFTRGQEMTQSASIQDLQVSSQQASALINSHYVKLDFQSKHFSGQCDCPVSDGFDFCEHCVCLCLYLNKQNQQIRSLAKGPDKSKILAFLLSLDKQTLAKHCLELITQDASQFDRYLLKASLHQGEVDYSQLKSQITQLTKKPETLFSQRQVKVFFSKLEHFIAELAAPDAPSFDHEKFQKVIEYAFQRLNLLLEQIDDSTDQKAPCIELLRNLYFSLLRQKQCRDQTIAKHFLSFWLNDRFDLLGLLASKQLNPAVANHFKLLAEQSFVQSTQKKENVEPLLSWQTEKLARYLFEEAIQSHDNLIADEYRPYFSKD